VSARAVLVLLLLIVGIILLAVVTVWAVRRGRAIVFDEDRYPGLVALRRLTIAARYTGLAAGAAVFVVVACLGRLGRGLFLAPAASGAVLIVAVVLGQHSAYGAARTAGVAGVERRRIRDYLPRGLTLSVLLFLAVLVASASWTTLAASEDDLGLHRAYAVTGSETVMTGVSSEVLAAESTRSPFPGAFYTSMPAIGLPIVLVLGAIALWLTARRPRNGADPELVPADDALRRQTSEGIVAAVGLSVSLSLLGVALPAAMTVAAMAEYGLRYTFGAAALALAALASLAVASWCTVLVLVPGGGVVKRS
jgi:hypothetical protein